MNITQEKTVRQKRARAVPALGDFMTNSLIRLINDVIKSIEAKGDQRAQDEEPLDRARVLRAIDGLLRVLERDGVVVLRSATPAGAHITIADATVENNRVVESGG